MPLFDVGVEGKLRIRGVEAASGEAARNLVLARFKDFVVRLERSWFEASPQSQPPNDSPILKP